MSHNGFLERFNYAQIEIIAIILLNKVLRAALSNRYHSTRGQSWAMSVSFKRQRVVGWWLAVCRFRKSRGLVVRDLVRKFGKSVFLYILVVRMRY